MGIADRKNIGMMNLIKRAHGIVENVDIEKHRQSQDHLGALLTNKKEVNITDVSVGDMHCEWIRANRIQMKKAIILYCHGGGYSTGSSLYARTLTGKLATTTLMDVFSFDYRLSPEHPYPAALEDAKRAWDYLMLQGYGAKDIIVAGDSAGGNLALALTLKLKEEGIILPKGLVLMSPWTDLCSTGKSHESRAELDPILNKDYLAEMIKNYAPKEDLKNPYISPLYGDFTGFPPTYIQVGDAEILLNDATMLQKKMVKEGVWATIDIYKGMWHVFQMSPLKNAYEAMDKIADFIFTLL